MGLPECIYEDSKSICIDCTEEAMHRLETIIVNLQAENEALKVELSDTTSENNRYRGVIACLEESMDIQMERAELKITENAKLRKAIKKINMLLQIPAAEYVPAISDIFTVIDDIKKEGVL